MSRRHESASGNVGRRRGKFVRDLASQDHSQEMHILWRPFLANADDDMVLKLAWLTQSQHIITHNRADFRAAEQLGVTPLSPREFLELLRAQS